MFKSAYLWMGRKVHSPHASLVLGILFYFEAIFFLPTDPMLIVYCLERRGEAYKYALIATIGSVLGGITGYFIGYLLWKSAGEIIIHSAPLTWFIKPTTFKQVCSLYQQNQIWALMVASIPPIPYKIATLAAGFCQLSLVPFIIISFLARAARFFLLAAVISKWGESMKTYLDKYITRIAIGGFVTLVAIIWFIK